MLSLHPKVGGMKKEKKEEEEKNLPSEDPCYCKGVWVKFFDGPSTQGGGFTSKSNVNVFLLLYSYLHTQ